MTAVRPVPAPSASPSDRRWHRRTRWLGVGAITVMLAGSGTWEASASVGSTESTFVPVTPTRILDTRDPVDLGLAGPFVSPAPLTLTVTGEVPTADGPATVVPVGASGILLNVTVVAPQAAGFVSIRPDGTPGAPSTSNLNFEAGVTTPNAVVVELPPSGVVEITYDAYGQVGPTVDVLVDVLGYTTREGLASIVAQLAAKANAAEVYTRAELYTRSEVYTRTQVDTAFVPHGTVEIGHGHDLRQVGAGGPVVHFASATRLTNAAVQLNLQGPNLIGGIAYGLVSVEYCLTDVVAPGLLLSVTVAGGGRSLAFDGSDKSSVGCYTIDVNTSDVDSYVLRLQASASGHVDIGSVTSTWAPADQIP